jgi:alkylated DNA repair dioxygenase AlkB
MEPIYVDSYIASGAAAEDFVLLCDEVSWLTNTPARKESFMADKSLVYQYGIPPREYASVPFHPVVKRLRDVLNRQYNTNYNVCFLNRYDNESKALGWHADDSPEMDMDHPIAVISLGEVREIWWRKRDEKGVVPTNQRKSLSWGSLFIMPAGFQKDHLHRIPKGDRPKGIRISLTFRHYKNP